MELALQNPWWKNKTAIETDEKVAEALRRKPAVIYQWAGNKNKLILGPRQVGKTSYLKLLIYDLIKNKKVNPIDICYFSCEPLRDKNDLIAVVKEFRAISSASERKYFFYDEVTQIPDWEKAIKFILETELSQNLVLYATGSNALLLKRGGERLPGRNISTELFLPLTFAEFIHKFGSSELQKALNFNLNKITARELYQRALKLVPWKEEVKSLFYSYLKTGGYLKAIFELSERRVISEETYEIYIKWILGDIAKLGLKEHLFKSILMGILKSYGTKFSLHSLAKETEIKSHLTVADYLEALQSLLVINQLYQLDYDKRIPLFRKEKKSYFMDPFLYHVCRGYSRGKYQDYSDEHTAVLVEGIVAEALARPLRLDLDFSSRLWFYTQKKETDFALSQGNSLVGIEVKWQNKVNYSDFANFSLFSEKILLSKDDFEFSDKNNFLVIPTYFFLALRGIKI